MAQEFKIGRLRYTWKGVWETGTFYNRDAVVQFDGKTYVSIIPHTSTGFYEDYFNVEPSGEVKPYWTLMLDGQSWVGEWEPTTAYTISNIVLYAGTVYKCIANHTSTSTFNAANWQVYVAVDSSWVNVYTPSTFYYKGDVAKFGGIVYKCNTEHQANANFFPDYTKWTVQYEGIEFKGEWDPDSVQYKTNDIVKYGPDLWICQFNHTSSLGFDATIDTADSSKAWLIWIPGSEYQNSWNQSIVYQPGDVVMYGGYSYICLTVNNQNLVPPDTVDDSTPAWDLLTIGYKFLGEWMNSTVYEIGSVVRNSGSLYQAVQNNTNQSPTDNVVTTTYNSTGSSGRTLKVASTTGLSAGMFISGLGFSKGQFIDSVNDSVTLTISEEPYTSITNGATLTFSGVDTDNWELITQGIRWRNRWSTGQNFVVGDIAVYINNTYRCIRNHPSNNVNRPDQDTTNSYWVVYLNHDRNNVLNNLGDIIVNSNGSNIALPIGSQGYLLKSVTGVPTWSNFLQTPKVYYVTPDGTDTPGSGTTWDNPWSSIKYACNQIQSGLNNSDAKQLFLNNRNFIEEEAWQWQVFQITNNIAPFISTLNLDEEKTRRDTKYLIDAIAYDLGRGGNSQIIAFTLAFFDKVARFKYATDEVADQIDYFIATIDRIITLMATIGSGSTVTPLYQTLNGIPNPVVQQSGPILPPQVIVDIESFRSIIISALTAGDSTQVPPENAGLTATIQIKTGTYREELPIVIPANTALNGDELRGVVVYPKLIINTLVTRSFSGSNRFVCKTTEGMVANTTVQFDSIFSVNGANSVFGNVTRGINYYVVAGSITDTQFSVSATPNGPAIALTNFTSQMYVYGGDALKDMFRCQNGTGIRNMTLSGLLGCLSDENIYLTRRPTGGVFVGLDTGNNQDDTSAWIYRKSPYIQNVTTFGRGAVGLKIDGSYHNGGNKSIVCNDFTQIISDGIGVWCTGTDALCEAVSVFSYYAYAGYFAEAGGRIRATNGNSSYGTFGVVAEGFDTSEIPISGLVNNRYFEAQATPFSSLGSEAEILKIQYSHAGQEYYNEVTNLLTYSNGFTTQAGSGENIWTTDGNLTLVQSVTSPFGTSDAWIATGTSATGLSGYLNKFITITPSGAQYSSVAGTNITGGGVSATFNIIVSSTAYLVTINSGGSGYVVSNQIRILGSQLGGISPANDLIITVTGLAGTSISAITTAGTVQVGSVQPYYFSMYVKEGNSPSFEVQASFSGYQATGSTLTYNFTTSTLLPGTISGGMTPSTYNIIPVSNAAGWYRLSFVFYDATGLNNTLNIRVYPKGLSSITGYSLIYGAQLELGNTLGFYSSTNSGRYTSNANFIVRGPGTGLEIVANEIRSASVYKTRLLEVNGITGGKNYLFVSNNAQAGTAFSLTIAASDTTGEKPYLGMRLFVNTGLGAGQYGTIAYYDPTLKEATVLKESFSQIEVTATSATTDQFTVSLDNDPYTLYNNQPIQFVPTHYEIDILRISQDDVNVLATNGGTANIMIVTSTAKLTLGMPVNFSGTTYGGVTNNFTYYIVNIIDETSVQVSTTLGGTPVFLNNASGDMQLNFPAENSYLHGSTTNMQVNLPIYFTGNVLSSVVAGQTYYVNEIFGSNDFTISQSLLSVAATVTTVNTDYITVDNTANLVNLNPIIFTGNAFGSIVPETKYYINHIVNATQITITESIISTTATASVESSDLITVQSTAGFIIGNPVTFTGPMFGSIVNDQVYYIHYVNNGTSFAISNSSTLLTVTATATSAINNRITVGTTTNLTPLNPIVFRGTDFGNIVAGTTYYVNRILSPTEFTITGFVISRTATATLAVSNLITVESTAGFQADNPVIFGGNTFGGIVSGQLYYVSAVNDLTSFTISTTPGGSAVILTTGEGTLTVRTGTTIVLSNATGSLAGYSRFTNAAVSLINGVGEVLVRTSDESVALTTSTGTLTGTSTTVKEVFEADAGSNMTGTFTVPLLGGISQGTTYYIRTIDPTSVPATFTITSTSNGATDVALIDGTGSMQMGEVGWDHVSPGTPLVINFDSTSSYSIEPRVYYENPTFGVASSSVPTQIDPLATYIGISFGRSTFAALPATGTTLAVSSNGINWTTLDLPVGPGGTATWSNIKYGSYYWVVIANGNSGGSGSRVLYSNSNLQTWKSSQLPSNATWSHLTYGNGKFVAITNNSGSSAYSTNFGANWTAGSGLPSASWRGIIYGKGIFIAVATGTATAARSTDGITWTSVTLPRSDTWSRVEFGNGRFVAISSTLSTAVYSFDGQTWYTGLYNIKGTQLGYGNGLFVVSDETDSIFYYSEDGLAWKRVIGVLGSGRLAFGIASGVGKFISVSGLSESKIITGGSKTKSRPVLDNGVIVEINEWDPGSNYNTEPDVFIADTNATVKASVIPLTASGSLADPSFVNRGSGYNTLTTTISINGDGFADDFQTGISLIFSNLTRLPSPGDNLSIEDDDVIYKVTAAVALDGTTAPLVTARIDISPEMTVGKSPDHAQPMFIRTKYSQGRLTNHDFLNIGYGNFEESNYPRLPIDTVLSAQNETVESNYGRVFYSSTDQDGNFRVGELFAVEQATGIVTLSASQFGLSGLDELSIGGVSIGGSSVIITQFSTDETFTANSNNIVPTQKAIKAYLAARLTQGGSNTFTGELTAGTVKVGGPDRIQSTVPEGNQGSRVRIPVKANVSGFENGGWDGDGMALAYFFKTLITDTGVPNGQ